MAAQRQYSYSIDINAKTLEGNTDTAYIQYRSDIPLDLWIDENTPQKRWQMCLANMTCYNTQPNVSDKLKNNILSYKWGANAWRNVVLPNGTYTVEQLNAAIQNYMKVNGDYTPPVAPSTTIVYDIQFLVNIPLHKIDVILATTGVHTIIDWHLGNFRYLFGFNDLVLDSTVPTTWSSDTTPDMTAGTETFNVDCSAVVGSQSNGRQSSYLYTFSPSVSPGELIRIEPYNQRWCPLRYTNQSLSEMTIRLVSNTGAQLDLGGENVTLTLLIKYAEVY